MTDHDHPDTDWTAAARDMLATWDAWFGGSAPDRKDDARRLLLAASFAAQAFEDAVGGLGHDMAPGHLLRAFLVALIDWEDPQLDHLRAVNRVAAAPVAEAQCCMCGKTGLSTSDDDGPECQLEDGRWVCTAECYDRAVPQPTIGGAELDELVARLRSFDGDGHTRFAGKTMCEMAADAITALRAQPDWKAQYDTAMQSLAQAQNMIDGWKAMAERLGVAGGKLDKAASEVIACGAQTGPQWSRLTAASLHFRAALSDLAKMKDATK